MTLRQFLAIVGFAKRVCIWAQIHGNEIDIMVANIQITDLIPRGMADEIIENSLEQLKWPWRK